MNTRTRSVLTLLAALLAVIAIPSTTLAQRPMRHRPIRQIGHPSDPVNPTKVPTLACCHCIGDSNSLDLSTGAAVWTVAPVGGTSSTAVLVTPNVSWTNNLAPAKWIGPPGAPQSVGSWAYETTFYVQQGCVIPSTISLSGKFAADNTATLQVDNQAPVSLQGTPNYGFLPGSVTSFGGGSVWTAGPHTIRVTVGNAGGPTGLVVSATLTRKCTSSVVLDSRNPIDQEGNDPKNPR